MKTEDRNVHASASSLSNERYDFRRSLGSGASAKVWIAHDKKKGKDVAIKVYASWSGSDSQSRQAP